MKAVLKWKLIFTTCFFVFSEVVAQPFSYVYIQGDKITPFYVKLEGKMMPRYGKNHCIISELGPGTIDIEVLFQQNSLPPRKFTIDVPENGALGFLLDKQGSGFALYDLQTRKYLMPNDETKK